VTTPQEAVDELENHLKPLSPLDARAAVADILGCFIWLLATFIGDDIVLRLVHDIWPKLPSTSDLPDGEESSR
jgi:hypothetical protein